MTNKKLQEKLGKETKYSKYYLLIIEKAKLQNRKKLKKDNPNYTYYENHHILPKSIFPEYKDLKEHSWNGVLLTAKERFICHALIWKHYKKLELKYEEIKMSKALRNLSNSNMYNSKQYQLFKTNLSHTEETKKKISLKGKGRKHTEEAKKKISLNSKGKSKSEETKKRIGIKSRGRKHTVQSKKKLSEINMGKKLSMETKQKISLKGKGKKRSEETKKRISSSKIKQKNIYNEKDELMFICFDDFYDICLKEGIPINAITKTYKDNTKINFKMPQKKNIKYIGWYARIIST